MTEGYSGAKTAEIVGITYRQLDYWARTDLIRPSLADANGSGTRRRYSYRDLLELKVIKSLLDAGIRLESGARGLRLPAASTSASDVTTRQPRHRRPLGRAGPRRRRAHRPGQPGPGRAQHPAAGQRQGRGRRPPSATSTPGRPGPATAARRGRSLTLKHSPLDAAHRRLGRQDGGVRRLGHAAVVPDGHDRRAPGVPAPGPSPSTSAISAPSGSTGAGAFDRLQRAFTNDLGKIGAGPGPVHPPARRGDASVLDDIIVWWVDDGRFDVMPNASNTDRVVGALGGGADVTAGRAIVAVQGPDGPRAAGRGVRRTRPRSDGSG